MLCIFGAPKTKGFLVFSKNEKWGADDEIFINNSKLIIKKRIKI